MFQSEPPKLVGAWSDDADDMVREWQASRDWLTRELTVDNINEEKMKEEKQVIFFKFYNSFKYVIGLIVCIQDNQYKIWLFIRIKGAGGVLGRFSLFYCFL